jgi:delta1-piperideine-2-carboxylate reductase
MMKLTLDEAHGLADDVLRVHGVSDANREILVGLVLHAEANGSRSHGLMRLPDYCASIRAKWLDPHAAPTIRQAGGPFISADCNNGFTQVASALARETLTMTARRLGMAALTVRNGHHIGALWCDIEPLAHEGLVAFNFVNSRCRLAPYGSSHKLLGTNAMAFSVPDGNGGAITWDQASSVMSLGDIKLHAAAGKPVPEGVGLDATGRPTREPRDILASGAVLPFGGHKGSSIALMVEVMAAALTGGNFGFEDDSPAFPGAASSNAGQFLLVIDPMAAGQQDFMTRMRKLVQHLREDEAVRLPGDRRAGWRSRHESTLALSDEEYAALDKLRSKAT